MIQVERASHCGVVIAVSPCPGSGRDGGEGGADFETGAETAAILLVKGIGTGRSVVGEPVEDRDSVTAPLFEAGISAFRRASSSCSMGGAGDSPSTPTSLGMETPGSVGPWTAGPITGTGFSVARGSLPLFSFASHGLSQMGALINIPHITAVDPPLPAGAGKHPQPSPLC